jgi:hypothetical protein
MNLFAKVPHRSRRTIVRLLNLTLILLLLFGYMPMSAQGAQVKRIGELCQPPQTQNSLFLPLVAQHIGQLANLVLDVISPQAAAARVLAYEVGKTYQYEYQLTVNTKSSKRDATGVSEDGSEKTVIYALAELSITGKEQDGTFVGQVVLKAPFICNTDGTVEARAEDEETFSALATPLLFKQAPNGVITSVSAPANAPAQSTNIQKGVLNALQLTLQEGNSYTALEDGGQGTVNAQYTIEELSDGLHITKTFNRQSFSNLITQGPANDELILQNTIDMVLDSSKGVINLMTYSEKIASGDGKDNRDSGEGFNGVTAWSTAESTGSLKLKDILPTTGVIAAAPDAPYVVDSLGGTLVAEHPNRRGIDLTQVDLNAEFAKLESDPTNPDQRAYILDLVDADDGDPNDGIDVLGKIGERLVATIANPAVAKAYIDLLGSIGTPRAQEMLSAVLGDTRARASNLLLAPFAEEIRDQALLNISILDSPTITTVNTVQSIVLGSPDVMASSLSTLQGTAVSVLGAVANNLLDENAEKAKALADLLAGDLEQQVTAETIGLYLDALGNAGHPSSLATIKKYIDGNVLLADIRGSTEVTTAIDVQVSALVALRKLPGDEPESLLLGALTDPGELDVVRTVVANVLSTRDNLSEEAAAALDDFGKENLASPGRHTHLWDQMLGNSDLGIAFPGGTTLLSPPAYEGLSVVVYQRATALIYGRSFDVLSGELRTYRSGDNQIFGAYLNIGGNLIRREYEESVPCAASREGTLSSISVSFIKANFKIPIYAVITLEIDIRSTGNFKFTYELSVSICNPADMTASAGITPSAWATVSASASLNIVFVRGGVTLSATILNTSIDGSITAGYDALANNFRFCIEIKVETQPLSGKLTAWADRRVLTWSGFKWKRIGEITLWRFESPSSTYALMEQCW